MIANERSPVRVARVRDLFLRSLGVVFLTAFASLEWQIAGLVGEDGLEPASQFLAAVAQRAGGPDWLRVPTVFWLASGDAWLRGACLAGVAASVLLALGLVPLVALAACWLLYLSVVGVGGSFLSYQWDALLLETGFLALFWAPAAWRLGGRGMALGGASTEPSHLVLWMFRWLVFRLMFLSGWVKLASGDPVWWNLTALGFHYETQPLPAWTSWWAHQLPGWFQRASCALMFGIELGLPLLIPFGRRPRAVAAAGFLLLQVLIAATGNYGYFNLLAAVLCLTLLDDRQLPRFGARAARTGVAPSSPIPASAGAGVMVRRAVRGAVAALLLLQSVPLFLVRVGFPGSLLPAPIVALANATSPLRLTSGYGLFAVMTTTRPEIVIEGSAEGGDWKPYGFRWKPGPIDRAPGFVEPGMPRLDWQMWFDALAVERALDGARVGRGLVTPRLLDRLFEPAPEVRRLLLVDPFDGVPPDRLRWRLYRYRFTDRATRADTGHWWTRSLLYESPEVRRPRAASVRPPEASSARFPASWTPRYPSAAMHGDIDRGGGAFRAVSHEGLVR